MSWVVQIRVSAITDMKIAKDKDVELKFLVNGEEEVTKAEFDEKYGEEGYTVEFNYTFSNATEDERAGKVNKKNDFRYAVQVKDAEDNLIPEKLVAADYKKVEVVEAGKAVEVTELGLEDWNLDYVTTTDENVKIEVVKAVDALGIEVKDAQLPEIKKVVSDDIRIAYYNGTGIVPVKAGEVTFTVEFVNEDVEDVEYTVEVKAGQKASSIDIEEPVKVKAKEASTVKFDVLDQYEEMLRADADLSVKVGEADAKDVTVTKGVATLQDLNLEKGTHKVVVKADNKEIGAFDIQAVDVVEGEIDEYKLVFDTEKTSLDINPLKLENGADTLKINVEAYIDGVEVELDGTELEAKSSDVDVATVKLEEGTIIVTAEAEGTTTVSLYTKEGDLVTEVDKIDVEVKNTTPQIDTLKSVREDGRIVVADDTKTGDIVKFDYNQLKTEDVELEEGNTLENVISGVRYVKNNHQVVVTVKDEFGGKSFVFDAIDKFSADLEDLEPTVTDGKEAVFQRVSIPWADDMKDKKFNEVFTEFKIELLNDNDEVLASGDYVFKEWNKDHKVGEVTGIAFRFWDFERNDTFGGNNSWVRSGYKNGIASGEEEVNGADVTTDGFELATEVRVTMKTATGETVVIDSLTDSE